MKRIERKTWKYIITVLFLLMGNLLFFLTVWMTRKYDKVSLDQFIYQMKASAVGTNRSLIGSAYVQVGVFGIGLTLIEVLVFHIFAGSFANLVKKIFKTNTFYVKVVSHWICRFFIRHVFPIALSVFFLAMTFFVAKLNFVTYVENITTDSTFIEKVYVDPNEATITFPETKRNLIYIFLESLEVTFAEPEAGGPITENYMPELSALAENNINFSNDDGLGGAISFSGTTWTAAAMVTQTSGVIMQVPLGAPNYSGEGPYMPGVTSIGQILSDAGYRNTLLVGSNADFHDRADYFEDHGNYDIIDTESLKEEGRLPEDYRVWWGFEDTMLFDYAKEELTRISAEEGPFNFTMLTCDTHFPNGYVCDECEDIYGVQYPNVVRCSSRHVAEFVEWIQQQPFYENTTIVISGDHLTMDPDFMKGVAEDYQRTIYNCIINAPYKPVNEKNRVFGTYDMMPTTLGALGAHIEGNRLALGTDLFSGMQTLAEQYGFNYVDLEFQRNSEFYNKTFLKME